MQKILTITVSLIIALAATAQDKGRKFVSVTCSPTHNEYQLGQDAVVRILATEGGSNIDDVAVSFEAGQANLLPDTTGTSHFVDGLCTVNIGHMDKPGFRRCKVKFTVSGQSYTETVTVGYTPSEIRPTVTEPKDFDTFWQKTLREASRIPMDISLTPDPSHTNDSVLSQMIRFQNYAKGQYIYGYLTRPRDGKQHPVMLRVPGAGVKKVEFEDEYSKEGFIVLSIGICGFPCDVTDSAYNQAKRDIGNYWLRGIESRDTYYYRHVYCALVRAIDILTSQPDWDGKTVATYGGSQGGALAMVAAGLDRRVSLVIACYPALCDIGGYQRGTTGGWPNINRPGNTPLTIPAEQWLKTVSYYDVALFARRITATGWYTYGYNDATCAPTSTCGAINCVTAPKTVVTTPSSGHWRYPETRRQHILWTRQML